MCATDDAQFLLPCHALVVELSTKSYSYARNCSHASRWASTVHLENNVTNKIVNELPNTDCLTTGNLNEKDFWSAQCMQCASRCTTQNFEDLRQSFKFVYIKKVR